MSTPVVMRLHPTDAAPAVVFNSFPLHPTGLQGADMVEVQGVMRAVNGSDGSPIWSAPGDMFQHMELSVNGNSGIAAGDCMGTGETCFITGGWDPTDEPPKVADSTKAHQHGGLIAFGSDGRFLWVTRQAQLWWGAPVIARLLGPTGPAQVVVGNGVFDGATGKTLCPETNAGGAIGGNGDGSLSAIADIDLDGVPEIVTGNQAYKLVVDPTSATGYTCKALFGTGVKMPNNQLCANGAGSLCPEGFPAVASFARYGALMGLKPDDPHPQIVVVAHGFLHIHDWTGGNAPRPDSAAHARSGLRHRLQPGRRAHHRRFRQRRDARDWRGLAERVLGVEARTGAGFGAPPPSTAPPTPAARSSTSRARASPRWCTPTSARSRSSTASPGSS